MYPGTDPQVVRNNARNLFKASVEQVERDVRGQPVVIRNRLEQDQAEKYRAVLARHGHGGVCEADGRRTAGSADSTPAATETAARDGCRGAPPPAELAAVPAVEPVTCRLLATRLTPSAGSGRP